MKRAYTSPRQRGVALAVVVWFLAGMSLLVAGIVLDSRRDVRLAQIHVEKARVTAAGDGAANLLLADMLEGRFAGGPESGLAQGVYRVGAQEVSVAAIPADWLVDLNTAPVPILAQAFRLSGSAGSGRAQELATAVVQWRSARSLDGQAQRFNTTEDLLGVTGVGRTTLDSMRDYVAEPRSGRGLAQANAGARARLQAVSLLAPGNRASAVQSGVLPRNLGQSGRSGAFRVDAIVETGGRRWLRRRWIDTGSSGSSLPWRVLRTEPARVVGE